MTNVKELPSSFIRRHWREMLNSMLEGGPDIVIMRYKKAIAVMIPARDYEAIEDLLHDVRKVRVSKIV